MLDRPQEEIVSLSENITSYSDNVSEIKSSGSNGNSPVSLISMTSSESDNNNQYEESKDKENSFHYAIHIAPPDREEGEISFSELKKYIESCPAYNSTRIIFDEKKGVIYFDHSLKEIEAAFPELQDNLLTKPNASLTEKNLEDYSRGNIQVKCLKGSLKQRQAQLIQKARDFFSSLKESKSITYDFFSNTANKMLLEAVQKNDVVCIGEIHQHRTPKKLLIDNMKQLKKLGVDVIFMEHLLDTQRDMLAEYISGKKTMPTMLKEYLSYLDHGNSLSNAFPYNFTGVVMEAAKYGIQIIPIDTDTSYSSSEFSSPQEQLGKDPDGRGSMMNYIAYQEIVNYKMQHEKKKTHGKAIIFTGSAHINKQGFGVPGIQELVGCPTVLVEDCNGNEEVARGTRVPKGRNQYYWVYPDYRITMRAIQFVSLTNKLGKWYINLKENYSKRKKNHVQDIVPLQDSKPSSNDDLLDSCPQFLALVSSALPPSGMNPSNSSFSSPSASASSADIPAQESSSVFFYHPKGLQIRSELKRITHKEWKYSDNNAILNLENSEETQQIKEELEKQGIISTLIEASSETYSLTIVNPQLDQLRKSKPLQCCKKSLVQI